MYPDVLSETKDFDTIPLFVLSPQNTSLIIHFFWIKDYVELNYEHLSVSGEDGSRPIELDLTFQDLTGFKYEEVFQVSRDSRFEIVHSHDLEALNETFDFNIQDYGLV